MSIDYRLRNIVIACVLARSGGAPDRRLREHRSRRERRREGAGDGVRPDTLLLDRHLRREGRREPREDDRGARHDGAEGGHRPRGDQEPVHHGVGLRGRAAVAEPIRAGEGAGRDRQAGRQTACVPAVGRFRPDAERDASARQSRRRACEREEPEQPERRPVGRGAAQHPRPADPGRRGRQHRQSRGQHVGSDPRGDRRAGTAPELGSRERRVAHGAPAREEAEGQLGCAGHVPGRS